jgi:hypothetical protein
MKMGGLTGDRGEGDFLVGNVDPMVLPKIFIFLPPFSYQSSDTDSSTEIASHHPTDVTIRHSSDTNFPFEPKRGEGSISCDKMIGPRIEC